MYGRGGSKEDIGVWADVKRQWWGRKKKMGKLLGVVLGRGAQIKESAQITTGMSKCAHILALAALCLQEHNDMPSSFAYGFPGR